MNPFARRFRLIDLLVVCCIAACLAGLVVVCCLRVRTTQNRFGCIGNLKELGQAFKSYHDSSRHFPSEAVPNPDFVLAPPKTNGRTSFYCYLLPHLGQTAQHQKLMGNSTTAGDLNQAEPVRQFLCPNRHDFSKPGMRALRDYGYRKSAGNMHAILDSAFPTPLTTITNLAGTPCVALITHYWWDADSYYDPSRTNQTDGWANPGYNGKTRGVDQIDSDLNQLDSDELPAGVQTAMGSPHPEGNPTLLYDGSIVNLPYDPNWPGLKDIFYYDSMTSWRYPEGFYLDPPKKKE